LLQLRCRRWRGVGVKDAAVEDGERIALVDEGVGDEGNGNGGEAIVSGILLVAEELLGTGLVGGEGRRR